MPTIAAALAAFALLGTACGDSAVSEVSAEEPPSSSRADADHDSAASEDDPSVGGETSSASSGDDDGATDASDAMGSGADDADLDDAVSNSNDGTQDSGGQSDPADEQPVVGPDGTETFGPQEGEREHAEIIDVQRVVRESWPLQLAVIISGELRDGCQELAWEMRPDGASYDITVWQVVPPANAEMACTMAIVPFETQIELGTSETDDFAVIVNGLAY